MASRRWPGYLTGLLLIVLAQPLHAASLEAGSTTLPAGTSGSVVVTGAIDGEATYGVTILVEIVPRAGNTGSLAFTPAPPTDIMQAGDPWPAAGTFSAYDTDAVGLSASTNGAIDDNGTFVPTPVSYSGALAAFPIAAGPGASGVWDVVLSTPVGDSTWEGVATTFVAGTVTVTSAGNVPAASSWTLLITALLICIAGTVVINQDGRQGVSIRTSPVSQPFGCGLGRSNRSRIVE